jgi:hypothetical protein
MFFLVIFYLHQDFHLYYFESQVVFDIGF